jgi:hypothetical protein
MSLWPGRRRSSSSWISAVSSGSRGGQPSTTTPTAGPWLSPQVVIVKSFPKLFGIAARERWARVPPSQGQIRRAAGAYIARQLFREVAV